MSLIQKAIAQTNFTWTDLTLTPSTTAGSTLTDLVNVVTNWVFIVAGVIAFFYLVYSGFIYLTAGGNPDSAKKGQQGIINAIIGLVIIFLAFAIVKAIISLLNTSSA
jgi:hypothetical protein